MEISILEDFHQLEIVRKEWEDICGERRVLSPLVAFDYAVLWYRCFANVDEVRVYKLTNGHEVIAFLPLTLKQKGVIRVLGTLSNDHCPHSGILVKKHRQSLLRNAGIEVLLSDRNGWDVFTNRFSYSFQAERLRFQEDISKRAGLEAHQKGEPTYSIFLRKTFEEYVNHDLSAKVRKNLKMYSNRLSKAGSHRFLHFRGMEALTHWSDFMSIEDSGWKKEAGSSIKRLPANFRQYYDGLVEILARMKCLHIYFLELRGQLTAGAFCYADGDVFHYAKIGYLEEFGEFSPSNLLLIHIIKDLICNFPQLKRLHMFPWDHGYKHRYTNEETYCTETIIFNNTFRGITLGTTVRLKERIRTSFPGVWRRAKKCYIRGLAP